MSYRVTNLCDGRKFGSPARKQVIMYMADKASDDGSGIWCAKGTIAQFTELGESTVKRVIKEFLCEGLLIETGKRAHERGFTVVYQIDLKQVERLDSLKNEVRETGSRVDGVQSEPPRGSTADPEEGPERTPNHPLTTLEPSIVCSGDTHMPDGFESFWKAHPRPRDRKRAESLFEEAVKAGVHPEAIVRAAERYRAEHAGNKRQYVAYADNWLEKRRWEDYQGAAPVVARSDTVRDAATFWTKKLKAGAYIPATAISAEVIACMIGNGLVQEQDLLRAGLRP